MRFSRHERYLTIDALEEAEERTSRYYCIPPFRWQSVPYDLLTLQDPEWRPLPEGMLARTRRIRREQREKCFYRIELNDPGILAAAHRENLRAEIYPFLLYILTHEMVHLVRLSHILTEVEEAAVCPLGEEDRVNLVARRILAPTAHPAIERILRRFQPDRAAEMTRLPLPGNAMASNARQAKDRLRV